MSEVYEEVSKSSRVNVEALGGDYFKIWIVNIFLSIVTLGIYSAWAKIRTRKYFMQTTSLEGHHFDFHAKPIPILKGRVIAGLIFLLYLYGSFIHPFVGLIGSLLFFVTFPFFVVKSLKFNFANTSYQNIRFRMIGTVKEGYQIFIKNFGIQVVLSLIIAAVSVLMPDLIIGERKPGVQYETSQIVFTSISGFIVLFNMFYSMAVFSRFLSSFFNFIYGNTYYGGVRAKFHITKDLVSKKIVRPYIKGVFIALILFFILIVVGTLFFKSIPSLFIGFLSVGGTLFYLGLIYVGYKMTYNTFCIVWNNLEGDLGDCKTELIFTDYFKLTVKNHLLTLLTLGLYYPWSKVSMYGLKNESKLISSSNFSLAVQTAEESESALSEEIGDAFDFDFDIGL